MVGVNPFLGIPRPAASSQVPMKQGIPAAGTNRHSFLLMMCSPGTRCGQLSLFSQKRGFAPCTIGLGLSTNPVQIPDVGFHVQEYSLHLSLYHAVSYHIFPG